MLRKVPVKDNEFSPEVAIVLLLMIIIRVTIIIRDRDSSWNPRMICWKPRSPVPRVLSFFLQVRITIITIILLLVRILADEDTLLVEWEEEGTTIPLLVLILILPPLVMELVAVEEELRESLVLRVP
jgi:hypothetical protein